MTHYLPFPTPEAAYGLHRYDVVAVAGLVKQYTWLHGSGIGTGQSEFVGRESSDESRTFTDPLHRGSIVNLGLNKDSLVIVGVSPERYGLN